MLVEGQWQGPSQHLFLNILWPYVGSLSISVSAIVFFSIFFLVFLIAISQIFFQIPSYIDHDSNPC